MGKKKKEAQTCHKPAIKTAGKKAEARQNDGGQEEYQPFKWDANAKMAVWVTIIGTIVLWLAATLRWD